MSVVLDNVGEEATNTPDLLEDAPKESATPSYHPQELTQEEVAPEPAETPAPVTPAPKKRGRPRKDEPATPKAPVRMKAAPKPRAKRAVTAPVAPPAESEEDDEPFSRADLETEILEFLVQRKTQQQDRRRQLWAQLAGL